MNGLEKNVNLPLLYEVRKDAFAKSGNVEQRERLFRMMHYMDTLARTARKEGLLALEEAAKGIPLETGFYQDIQFAVGCICDGMDAEDLTEILTARYWSRGLQGEDALLYFMMVLSVLRIQDCVSPYLLECLLKACLSDEAAEKYIEYKKQFQAQKPEPTPVESLLNCNPDIGEGGILVVRGLLEEKIEYADEKTLKKVIRDAAETDLELSLKGLSVSARKKLFSVIPEHKADEYAEHCEYMGPVRQIDVMAAMAELTAVFEKQTEKNA